MVGVWSNEVDSARSALCDMMWGGAAMAWQRFNATKMDAGDRPPVVLQKIWWIVDFEEVVKRMIQNGP